MFKKLFISVLLGISLFSCTESAKVPGNPKSQLTLYIEKSFSVGSVSDREGLLSFLTGKAKTRLASWSEDQFRQAFIDSKRKFSKLLIREIKSINANEVNITYELTYLDQSKGHDAKVTNKKLCHMIDQQGKWLISDVHNIKELVEYENEMSLP